MTNATHYLDTEVSGVCWRVQMNFRLRQMCYRSFSNQSQSVYYFPFVNDAEQLKQAITVLRQYGFTGKVGTMIELPSAYFDLDRILETGISKIVVGMNDLTSFIFATVRNSQWHDMESPIMLEMLRQMQDKARTKKIAFRRSRLS